MISLAFAAAAVTVNWQHPGVTSVIMVFITLPWLYLDGAIRRVHSSQPAQPAELEDDRP